MSIQLPLASPAVLRELSFAECDELAKVVRQEILTAVAKNAGHLGSNLGAVELSIALHRVFDSPTDPFIWDTGHQAYTHKLLTGRGLETLRQKGGVTGYPSSAESEHDFVESSHAGTAIGYVSGLTRAALLTGSGARPVAVVGDGSLTAGVALEALQHAAHEQLPIRIVLNDNGRSYAPSILPQLSSMEAYCASLGVAYLGPVDGHNLRALEAALEELRDVVKPTILHVQTQKGKGYQQAEQELDRHFHDAPVFDVQQGPPDPEVSGFTKVFSDTLVRLGATHSELVAISAAMIGPTGLAAFQRAYPARCIDTGIAEQQAVVHAAGLAMGGMRPIVAIYSTFLNRAWDQVVYEVALHNLPVVFVVDRAGVTGPDGASHHGMYDIALLSKVPGVRVLAPACKTDLVAMLEHVLASPVGPVAIRFPRGDELQDLGAGSGVLARKLLEGKRGVVVSLGRMSGIVYPVAKALGYTLWDARTLPLDPTMLEELAGCERVVTFEDGIVSGGMGEALARALPGVSVETHGLPAAFLEHGSPEEILASVGLDEAGVRSTLAA